VELREIQGIGGSKASYSSLPIDGKRFIRLNRPALLRWADEIPGMLPGDQTEGSTAMSPKIRERRVLG
jgi:hypothetical protein